MPTIFWRAKKKARMFAVVKSLTMLLETYFFKINIDSPKCSKRVYTGCFNILNFRNDLFYRAKDGYWMKLPGNFIPLKI